MEGILCATSREGAQTKQINPTMNHDANLWCCWKNAEKAPFNQRWEAGSGKTLGLLPLDKQNFKWSSGSDVWKCLLIQELTKYLTKKSAYVSAWFEGFPFNWINIPNSNSPCRRVGLKRVDVSSELGRSWRFSQPDELNRISEAIALYNTNTITLGIHKSCSAGKMQSVSK